MSELFRLSVVVECGFDDWDLIKEHLDVYHKRHGKHLHINYYREADRIHHYAVSNEIRRRSFFTNWRRHGKDGMHKRNSYMVFNSDGVLAFVNGPNHVFRRMLRFAEIKELETSLIIHADTLNNSHYFKLLRKV